MPCSPMFMPNIEKKKNLGKIIMFMLKNKDKKEKERKEKTETKNRDFEVQTLS
jgi:hypothetical protein